MNQDIEQQARDWWLALEAGRDDAALQARFDAWLAQDDRHRLSWLELLMAGNAADAAFAARPEHAAPNVVPLAPRRRARLHWAGGFALASAAMLAIVLSPDLPGRLQDWRADHHTAGGERRTLELADGSRVLLGPDSAIRVALGTDTRRIELLRGVATITVGEDPRPLSVLHDGYLVRDIGTTFRVDEAGDTLRVDVTDGVVDISRAGYPDTHRIVAGERLQWGADGIHRGAATHQPEEPGVLVLDEADAAQAFDQFARETGRDVRLWGAVGPGKRISAAMPVRDGTQQDAAFARLLADFGLAVRAETPGVTWVGEARG